MRIIAAHCEDHLVIMGIISSVLKATWRLHTVPERNRHGNWWLLRSNVGLIFQGACDLSSPLEPFIFGKGRSCRSETVRPDPVASWKVLPPGLVLPDELVRAIFMTAVMRRKRSKISSLVSCGSRGRGICDASWSRKYSNDLATCSSVVSHPGIGVECSASLLKLVIVETRLSQSTKHKNSYWLDWSFMLLSRNCSIERRHVTRNESWKPEAHGVLSRSVNSIEAAVL